ncbi:M23 family metallopeptidase [Novosphingobium huizhouense]|uniref:M23 family metallopeptidase n=1 Tax=Novosphingobium huizhouense TaxID=2866625 RepID=UPI001CD8C923|nr:M23 family metallopeptidase [Novosphingobium huizhouense]
MSSGQGWREKARLVLSTAAVTSAAWVVVGALWIAHRDAPGPVRLSAPAVLSPAAPSSAAPSSAAPSPAVERPAAPLPRLVMPVAGVAPGQLVDTYEAPRGDGTRAHHAIDIAAPVGTPVRAALAGRIDKLFLSKDGGNTIYIRSVDGATMTYYAHLSAYAPALAEGQPVAAGQVIGAVGATGNADPAAPHLHFEVLRTRAGAPWNEGDPVDPYYLLKNLP